MCDNEWWEGVDREEYLAELHSVARGEVPGEPPPGPINYAALIAISIAGIAMLLNPKFTSGLLGFGFVTRHVWKAIRWTFQRRTAKPEGRA